MKSLLLLSFLCYTNFVFSQGEYKQLIFRDSLTHVPITHCEGIMVLNDMDTIKIKTNSIGSMRFSHPNNLAIKEIILFTKDSTKCILRDNVQDSRSIEKIELFCTLNNEVRKRVVAQAKKDIKTCNAHIYVDPNSIVKMNRDSDSLFSKYGFRYSSSNEFEYSENYLTWHLLVVEYNKTIHEYLSFINGDLWKRSLILGLKLK